MVLSNVIAFLKSEISIPYDIRPVVYSIILCVCRRRSGDQYLSLIGTMRQHVVTNSYISNEFQNSLLSRFEREISSTVLSSVPSSLNPPTRLLNTTTLPRIRTSMAISSTAAGKQKQNNESTPDDLNSTNQNPSSTSHKHVRKPKKAKTLFSRCLDYQLGACSTHTARRGVFAKLTNWSRLSFHLPHRRIAIPAPDNFGV